MKIPWFSSSNNITNNKKAERRKELSFIIDQLNNNIENDSIELLLLGHNKMMIGNSKSSYTVWAWKFRTDKLKHVVRHGHW